MLPRSATRRVLFVVVGAVVLALVALGALLAFLATLVWTRNLEVRSDGDAVLEHLERHAPRQQDASGDGPVTPASDGDHADDRLPPNHLERGRRPPR